VAAENSTWIEQGWDPAAWGRRMDRRYQVQDRDTGQWRYFGDLFRKSPAQQKYARCVIREVRRGGPVRIIVLKGRKAGITTVACNFKYDVTTNVPGSYAGVLAHKKDSTNIVFRMVESFWRRTPAEFRPQMRAKNRTTMEFGTRYIEQLESDEDSLDSIYECATAGGDNPFTAGTPRLIHISEGGKMPGDNERQSQLLTSVLNAVPTNGPSLVTMEGTAQGWGNMFHKTWLQAEDNVRNGRRPDPGEWIPVFVGWQDDPLNQMAPSPDYRWDNWDPIDIKREKHLLRTYFDDDFSVAAPYLRWRRFKLQELKDSDRFDEEYPHCPEVAFLRSGRPAIPPASMDYLADLAGEPTTTYGASLEDVDDEAFGMSAVHWGDP